MRKLGTALMTLGLVVAMGTTAFAGDMAISSFDSLPANFEADKTYTLTYSVLQHGVTPVNGESSLIFTRVDTGETMTFVAKPTGEAGRYTVDVTIPSAGDWDWQVTQDMFPAQQMGVTNVAPPAVTVLPGTSFPLPLAGALLGFAGLAAVWMILRRSAGSGPAAVKATTQPN